MVDTRLPVFNADAQTAYIDMRTDATNLEGRQVVVLGDPSLNANVAAVLSQDGTTSDETTPAIAVRSVGSLAVTIAGATGTVGVYLHSTAGSLAVNVGRVQETVTVRLDPGYELGSIKGINTSIAVVPFTGSGSTLYDETADAVRVLISGSHTAASLVIAGQQIAGTNRPLIVNTDGAIKIYDIVAGTVTANVAGSLTGITNSIAVHLLSTGGTLTTYLDPGTTLEGIQSSVSVHLVSTAGTLWIKPDPAGTYFTNGAHTANIFTVAGSTSGGATSGVTLVAPSANASFKVFAFSLQTTGIVGNVWRFTNGGETATEFFRGLATAIQTSSTPVGANLAVQPPGFLFATGINTTLALRSDSGSLVHYSVSYFKESA